MGAGYSLAFLLLACIVFLLTSPVSAAIPAELPKLQWAASVGASMQAPPVLTADAVYAVVGTDDGQLCWVRLADGKSYRDDPGIPHLDAQARTPFRAAPLVTGTGAVYAANCDGRLYCRDVDGKTWSAPDGAPWGPLLSTPFVTTIAGREYIGVTSLDGNIYLVDPATHAVLRWLRLGAGIEMPVVLGERKSPGAFTTLRTPAAKGAQRVEAADSARINVGDLLRLAGVEVGACTTVDAAGHIVFTGALGSERAAGASLLAIHAGRTRVKEAPAVGQQAVVVTETSGCYVGDRLRVGSEELGVITSIDAAAHRLNVSGKTTVAHAVDETVLALHGDATTLAQPLPPAQHFALLTDARFVYPGQPLQIAGEDVGYVTEVAATGGRVDFTGAVQQRREAGTPVFAPASGKTVTLREIPADQHWALLAEVTHFRIGDLLRVNGNAVGEITRIIPATGRVDFTGAPAIAVPAGTRVDGVFCGKTVMTRSSAQGQTQLAVADTRHFFPGDDLLVNSQRAGIISAVDEVHGIITLSTPLTGEAAERSSVVTAPHRPLFVGSNAGRFYAYNADELTPTLRWVFPGSARRMESFTEAPLLVGDFLYGGNHAGALYAVHAYRGASLSAQQRNAVFSDNLSTPVLVRTDDRDVLVYAADSEGLVGADITQPTAARLFMRLGSIPGPVAAAPVADAAGNLLAVTRNGLLFAVHLADAVITAPRWQWRGNGAARAIVTPSGEMLVATADGRLLKLGAVGEAMLPAAGPLPAGAFTAPMSAASLRWAHGTGGAIIGGVSVARAFDVTRATRLRLPVAPGSTVLPVTDASRFFVGDPLVIGDDYLGVITAVERTAGRETLTVSDGATQAHDPAGHDAAQEIHVSLYRRDVVTGGETEEYGAAVTLVTAEQGQGSWWYNEQRGYHPQSETVTLTAHLTPRFSAKGQLVQLGFLERDSAVKHPGKVDSPLFLQLTLADDGTVRMCGYSDKTAYATLKLDGRKVQERGIDVALVVTPAADGRAVASGYCRFPEEKEFTRIGRLAVPLGKDAGDILPTAIYPFLHGQDTGDTHTFFSATAEQLRVYIASDAIAAPAAIGPGTRAFTVSHGERFLPGETVQIVHPTQPLTEFIPIARIEGNQLVIAAEYTVQNSYPASAPLWAGNPGEWMAFAGSDDGTLRAYNPSDGTIYWQNSAAAYLGAVRGTPVVDAVRGRVYVGSQGGRLCAFAQNGLFLWAYPPLYQPPLAPISGSPQLDGNGNIYLTTSDGWLYAITPDGIPARNAQGQPLGFFAGPSTICGLTLYSVEKELRLAISTCDGKLISLNGDLHPLWCYPDDLDGEKPPATVFTTAPVVGFDGALYVGDNSGTVHAVIEQAGKIAVRWRLAGESPLVSLAAASGVIYAAYRNGTLAALTGDAETATVKSHALSEPVSGQLTVDAAGNLLVGTARGSVYCLAPYTAWDDANPQSALRWRWQATREGGSPVGQPIQAAPTPWLGVTALVSSADGTIYAIGAPGPAGNAVTKVSGRPMQPTTPALPGPPHPTLRWVARGSGAPALAAATIYQGRADGSVTARDALTGELHWQVTLPDSGAIRLAPVAHTDGTLAVAAQNGKLYLLETASGTLRWQAQPAEYISTLRTIGRAGAGRSR